MNSQEQLTIAYNSNTLNYQFSMEECEADCYLWVVEGKKGTVVLEVVKAWVEGKTRRKQEWMVVVMGEEEKQVRKAVDKVKGVVGGKDERRVVKVVERVEAEREECLRNIRALVA